MKFKLIIVGGYAEDWIAKCIESVLKQDDANWEACIVLDPVDDSYQIAKQYESDRLKVFGNSSRQYQVANFLKAIEWLSPDDNDVLVFGPDADDWLYTDKALSIIRSYYEKDPNLLVTYGGFVRYVDNKIYCLPQEHILKYKTFHLHEFKNGIRRFWRGCHLKTMRYKLFKCISSSDLKDSEGEFLKVNGDMAVMVPALEMAGYDRVKRVEELIYVYNHTTPFMEEKLSKPEQRAARAYLESKKPYLRYQ